MKFERKKIINKKTVCFTLINGEGTLRGRKRRKKLYTTPEIFFRQKFSHCFQIYTWSRLCKGL